MFAVTPMSPRQTSNFRRFVYDHLTDLRCIMIFGNSVKSIIARLLWITVLSLNIHFLTRVFYLEYKSRQCTLLVCLRFVLFRTAWMFHCYWVNSQNFNTTDNCLLNAILISSIVVCIFYHICSSASVYFYAIGMYES